MKPIRILLLLISFTIILASCKEINTNDPIEAYKYWANMKPGEGISVVKGQYWESAHWSKEYSLFLELKATDEWINSYIKINDMRLDTSRTKKINGAPDWFNPPSGSKLYIPSSSASITQFFIDEINGTQYLYESQL